MSAQVVKKVLDSEEDEESGWELNSSSEDEDDSKKVATNKTSLKTETKLPSEKIETKKVVEVNGKEELKTKVDSENTKLVRETKDESDDQTPKKIEKVVPNGNVTNCGVVKVTTNGLEVDETSDPSKESTFVSKKVTKSEKVTETANEKARRSEDGAEVVEDKPPKNPLSPTNSITKVKKSKKKSESENNSSSVEGGEGGLKKKKVVKKKKVNVDDDTASVSSSNEKKSKKKKKKSVDSGSIDGGEGDEVKAKVVKKKKKDSDADGVEEKSEKKKSKKKEGKDDGEGGKEKKKVKDSTDSEGKKKTKLKKEKPEGEVSEDKKEVIKKNDKVEVDSDLKVEINKINLNSEEKSDSQINLNSEEKSEINKINLNSEEKSDSQIKIEKVETKSANNSEIDAGKSSLVTTAKEDFEIKLKEVETSIKIEHLMEGKQQQETKKEESLKEKIDDGLIKENEKVMKEDVLKKDTVTKTDDETKKVTVTKTDDETKKDTVTKTDDETKKVTVTKTDDETKKDTVTKTDDETKKVTVTKTDDETKKVTVTKTDDETKKVTVTKTDDETKKDVSKNNDINITNDLLKIKENIKFDDLHVKDDVIERSDSVLKKVEAVVKVEDKENNFCYDKLKEDIKIINKIKDDDEKEEERKENESTNKEDKKEIVARIEKGVVKQETNEDYLSFAKGTDHNEPITEDKENKIKNEEKGTNDFPKLDFENTSTDFNENIDEWMKSILAKHKLSSEFLTDDNETSEKNENRGLTEKPKKSYFSSSLTQNAEKDEDLDLKNGIKPTSISNRNNTLPTEDDTSEDKTETPKSSSRYTDRPSRESKQQPESFLNKTYENSDDEVEAISRYLAKRCDKEAESAGKKVTSKDKYKKYSKKERTIQQYDDEDEDEEVVRSSRKPRMMVDDEDEDEGFMARFRREKQGRVSSGRKTLGRGVMRGEGRSERVYKPMMMEMRGGDEMEERLKEKTRHVKALMDKQQNVIENFRTASKKISELEGMIKESKMEVLEQQGNMENLEDILDAVYKQYESESADAMKQLKQQKKPQFDDLKDEINNVLNDVRMYTRTQPAKSSFNGSGLEEFERVSATARSSWSGLWDSIGGSSKYKSYADEDGGGAGVKSKRVSFAGDSGSEFLSGDRSYDVEDSSRNNNSTDDFISRIRNKYSIPTSDSTKKYSSSSYNLPSSRNSLSDFSLLESKYRKSITDDVGKKGYKSNKNTDDLINKYSGKNKFDDNSFSSSKSYLPSSSSYSPQKFSNYSYQSRTPSQPSYQSKFLRAAQTYL